MNEPGESEEISPALDVPEELQRRAQELVQDAFDVVGSSLRRMTYDLEEFNRRRDEVRERIQRGARRSNGRVV